jgi:3-methylcrotonyl-CoA carboxylase alpha subunit
MYRRIDDAILLTLAGETYVFTVGSEIAAVPGGAGLASGSGSILATMPGVIAEVKVAVGDMVEAGQVVIVLESMKLFASLATDVAGVVVDVACQSGETVPAGKRLILIEARAKG